MQSCSLRRISILWTSASVIRNLTGYTRCEVLRKGPKAIEARLIEQHQQEHYLVGSRVHCISGRKGNTPVTAWPEPDAT